MPKSHTYGTCIGSNDCTRPPASSAVKIKRRSTELRAWCLPPPTHGCCMPPWCTLGCLGCAILPPIHPLQPPTCNAGVLRHTQHLHRSPCRERTDGISYQSRPRSSRVHQERMQHKPLKVKQKSEKKRESKTKGGTCSSPGAQSCISRLHPSLLAMHFSQKLEGTWQPGNLAALPRSAGCATEDSH